MTRTALITGILGQDGSFLTDLLLSKGYEVHGLVRPGQAELGFTRFPHWHAAAPQLHEADVCDRASVAGLVGRILPDEVYNLAAQSHVGKSFEDPWLTTNVNAVGALSLFLSVLETDRAIRVFQAGSADMFGAVDHAPQNELTPFNPQSPYASSKVFAHQVAAQFRQHAGLKVWNGILYPHESTRRPGSFVIRKVTKGVAAILAGNTGKLTLGNLASRRDWGAAEDTVRAMWLMLQDDHPDDYVVSTGNTTSVQQLVETAFGLVGLNWRDYIEVDPALFRPADPQLLVGDASRLRSRLGWEPQKDFVQLIAGIMEYDLRDLGLEALRYPNLTTVLES